jgi:hypothetical protein
MGSLDAVSKRKKAFKESFVRPFKRSDSRFGIRKTYLDDKEKPSIFSYNSPGKGQNGEHQN